MKKIVLVVFIIAGFLLWYTRDQVPDTPAGPQRTAAYDAVVAEVSSLHEEKVILYATDWCGYCKKTRAFLKSEGIAYYEYDIERSSQGLQQYQKLRGSGVPLLIVNSEIVRGYNTGAIVNALARK